MISQNDRYASMKTRKWSMVILVVAACFACLGCRPENQTYVEDLPPMPASIKLDEDTIRMRLLLTKLVQEDLRLTPEQTEKLRSLYETHAAQARKRYEKLTEIDSRTLSEEEAERFRIQLEDLISVQKKFRTECLTVLTPDQTERLKQIRLQTSISEAIERPEIAKALHLSEEQLEKILTLRDQMEQRERDGWLDISNQMPRSLPLSANWLNSIPPNQKTSMIEFQKTLCQDEAETTNLILNVFTPEQQAELEKLTGKKIDLTQLHDEWIENAESYINSANPETVSNPF